MSIAIAARRAFDCDAWEIRLLLRLRSLKATGVTLVHLDLAACQIVAKTDQRPESLDTPPAEADQL